MTKQDRLNLIKYLEQYEQAAHIIQSIDASLSDYEQRQLDRIAELRHSLILPSSASDGMPHSHANKDRMASVAAKVDEIERELSDYITRQQEDRATAKAIMIRIRRQVGRMQDGRSKRLIELRFIHFYRWFDIAGEFQTSEQNARKRLLPAALEDFIRANRRSKICTS